MASAVEMPNRLVGTVRGRVLLIPAGADEERDAVADAWAHAGGELIRLDRFWEPPPVTPSNVCIYGGHTFALVVAEKLGVELLSPPDDFMLGLDKRWLGRDVGEVTLSQIESLDYPSFVKPIIPKLFRAAVYQNSTDLQVECRGLEPDARLMFSSVIGFRCEARSFIRDNRVLDCAAYDGDSDVDGAHAFLERLTATVELPAACVIDIGRLANGSWVVLEANAAWGAGLNGCNAATVLPSIAAATTPRPH